MAIFSNNKTRQVLLQLLALLVIIGFFYNIASNAASNISSKNIPIGFAFLGNEAGFSIAESLIEYDESSSYFRAFLVGISNTLYVAIVSIICASFLGLFIGIAKLSRNWLISKLAGAYVELFRNIPLLLQILFWYNIILNNAPSVRQSGNFFDLVFVNLRGIYMPRPDNLLHFWAMVLVVILSIIGFIWLGSVRENLAKYKQIIGKVFLVALPVAVYFSLGGIAWQAPVLRGFNFQGGFNLSPEFTALAFALSIYTATYIAEAVRSGILSVAKGQKEAATALGFSPNQALKLVILPQALRSAIPPIISQYLNVAKNSSLAVAIGYPDLVNVFTGTTLNQAGQALEIIAMTMLVYLTISLSISWLLNIVNSRLKIIDR